MEVHHHTHHPKKWKEYFWEFFMLFLAVFCGSLAELQLEHYIEHQREKKYANSLVEDLENDAIDLKYDISRWVNRAKQIDTLLLELEKKPADRNHALVYSLVRRTRFNNTFLYHDRTISQLKNAGNFRLLRNSALADSLIAYDAFIKTAIQDIEASYNHEFAPYRIQLENKLFNAKLFSLNRANGDFDRAVQNNPSIVVLNPKQEDLVFEYYNCLVNDRNGSMFRSDFLEDLLRMGESLIKMLNVEYGLNQKSKEK